MMSISEEAKLIGGDFISYQFMDIENWFPRTNRVFSVIRQLRFPATLPQINQNSWKLHEIFSATQNLIIDEYQHTR